MNKIEIIPAILEQTWEEVLERLNEAEAFASSPNGSKWIQIDVADGIFTPEKSWNSSENLKTHLEALPLSGGVSNFEVDLMVKEPEKIVQNWIDAGAKRLVIHIETIRDVKYRVFDINRLCDSRSVEIGLAISIDTPNETLYPHLDAARPSVGYIQFMGIAKIGFQGQPFDSRVLHKINDLRKRYPNAIIQIDGGVDKENAELLIKMGANRLVVGSAIKEFQI